MKKQKKKINKIGIVLGIIFLIISRLLWWGILPREAWPDRGFFLLIALVFFHFSLFSKVGYKSVASEISKSKITGFNLNNIWATLIIGILFIAAFGALIVFAPNLLQSWLRKN